MLEGFDMGGFGGAAVCLVGVLPLAAFFLSFRDPAHAVGGVAFRD